MPDEIAENYFLTRESNAAGHLAFDTAIEPLWSASVSEQSFPAEMTASTEDGSFENPTSAGSIVNVVQNEKVKLTNRKRKTYVTSLALTQLVRDEPSKRTRANNKTGRTGKLLCNQCRVWRVKVQNSILFQADY